MPLNSSQLATLVERAKAKAPSPSVQAPAPARPRQAVPGATPASPPRNVLAPVRATAAAQPIQPAPLPAKAEPVATSALKPDDFPVGWQLNKESWHFHRKFFRKFHRPMRQGEYSYLLRQVWQRRAEHLGEHYWRVTLPDDRTTLVVTATRWQLGTILPKGWKPPQEMATGRQPCIEDA